MPVNESMLVTALQTNKTTITSADPAVEYELITTLNETKSILRSKVMAESIPFILYNDLWNQYGVHGPKRNHNRTTLRGMKINRGRLVFVDFGSNIGNEMSFPHPAVVVANHPGTITVVPMSSFKGSIPAAIANTTIFVDSSVYRQFDRDTLLYVHQMRTVDKNRIVRDIRKSIAGTPLMEQLEELIARTVALNHTKKLDHEIDQLKNELAARDELLENIKSWYRGGQLKEIAAALEKINR